MKVGKNSSGKLTKQPRYDTPLHKAYRDGDAVHIQIGKGKCKFLTPYPAPLYKACSAPVPGYVFTPSYKNKMWDGQHRFITKAGYFSLGLLPVVYAILKEGVNPLIKPGEKKHKVLAKPVENVKIVLAKGVREGIYPGMVRYYIDGLDILQYLNVESGEFAYPTKLLQAWSKVRETNPLAKPILDLAKALHDPRP